MLKISPKKALGKDFIEIAPMQDPLGRSIPRQERALAQVLRRQTAVKTAGNFYVRADGTKFPVHTTTTPVKLKGALIGTIVVFRDVSDEYAVNQSKNEFVNMASHQLRTPLTIIKWVTETLLGQEGKAMSAEQILREVEKIKEANERMLDTADTLLYAAQADTATLVVRAEEFILKDICVKAIAEVAADAKAKKIRLETKVAKLPKLFLDPGLITTICTNLLTNAIKYTPEGGQVTLSAQQVNGGISLACSDTGIGMSAQDKVKVFTKFYRSDGAKKIDPNGSGLGLYIVKSILEKVGGRIAIDSKPGKGTTFVVFLPLVQSRGAAQSLT
jgi:two-component system sensor histidine kinase VicK